jgi:hypothetical protein
VVDARLMGAVAIDARLTRAGGVIDARPAGPLGAGA